MTARLDIVLVNWNEGSDLHECLKSVSKARNTTFALERVVVVDNASTDGSIGGLTESVPALPLVVVENAENRGFAAACNQGARMGQAEHLLFLNPDTRLERDCLTKAMKSLLVLSRKGVGILGIQLVDSSGEVTRTCARFPTASHFVAKALGLDHLFPRWAPSYFMSKWDHRESREVDHVVGAFFLVRRSLFEALGGFDERFFVYLEDLDFSLRARQAGWRSYYLAESRAYHRGGGTTQSIKAVRLFYSLRSRILYSYKHFNWWSATGVALLTLLVEPYTRSVWALLHLSVDGVLECFGGITMLWRSVPGLVGAAWRARKNANPVA